MHVVWQSRIASRAPSLLLAAALQVLPVCRVAVVGQSIAPSAWAVVMAWVAGTMAVLGSYDGVSGASAGVSGLTKYSGATPVGLPTFEVAEPMGQSFRYRITVSNPGSDFDKNYFNCVPLPPGLTINTNVGAAGYVSGTPMMAGTYTVTLLAGNLSFPTPATAQATITIYLPNTLPIIVTQPADQSVLVGSNAVFHGEVDGTPPLAYQWRRDGAAISGETNATLVFNAVQVTNAAAFQLFVSNAFGSVTSSVARLTIREPLIVQLQLGEASAGNGVFHVRVTGPVRTNYVIYSSTDLQNWIPIATNWVNDGVLRFAEPLSSVGGIRAYRAAVTR